jgi:hypothetical protein
VGANVPVFGLHCSRGRSRADDGNAVCYSERPLCDGNSLIVLTDKHKVPFQIDAEDYETVSKYSWYLDTDGYAITRRGKGRTQRNLPLHTFLMRYVPPGFQVDHGNRDKLDNRRENLRIVTLRDNVRNCGPSASNTSGTRGVSLQTKANRWLVTIRVPGERIYLGFFKTLQEATEARKAGEQKYWGVRA